jgi:hypothetical protein
MARHYAKGQTLADVIPQTDKIWPKVPHLLKLNLLLLIPLLSSSVCGFDGNVISSTLLEYLELTWLSSF